MDPQLAAELRMLRARAYGPDADIATDAEALARLTELERLAAPPASPRVSRTNDTASTPAPAPATDTTYDRDPSLATTPSRGVDSSTGIDPDTRPDSDSGSTAHSQPAPLRDGVTNVARRIAGAARRVGAVVRRIPTSTLLWIATHVVAVLVSVTALIVVQRVQTDPLQVGATQIARLDRDRLQPAPAFVGGDDAPFAEFHGIVPVFTDDYRMSSSTGACLLLMKTTDLAESTTDSYPGEIFTGCVAGAFPASIVMEVGPTLPSELQAAFPAGTALQFAYDASNDEVVVFSDAPSID